MTRVDKLLIVDDNVDNVELLTKRFKSLGYKVVEAFDGEEALEKVDAEEPDLIVLDVMMPRMDGFEVCRRLKTNPKTRFIPVIMLTAKREVPDKIKGLDTGADDYVTKPFNPRELVARVNSLLQRRSSEKKQAAAEKLGALGQMAEGVAHEVRNPMVSIGGFARRIYDKLDEADPLRQYAAHIIKEVERLESMVEEIVHFKTVMISPYGEVDLSAIVAQVLAASQSKFKSRNIKARVEKTGINEPIQGDAQNIKLALANLVQNAIDAMPEGGELSVAFGKSPKNDGQVYISVTDTGEGIPRDDIPNVFDPFFTSKMSGAGMGLTMVHRIVLRHGGDVDITSAPGKGTTVTLQLPKTQDKAI